MNEKIKNPAPISEKQDKTPTIIKLANEIKHFEVPKCVIKDDVTIDLKSICQNLKGKKYEIYK